MFRAILNHLCLQSDSLSVTPFRVKYKGIPSKVEPTLNFAKYFSSSSGLNYDHGLDSQPKPIIKFCFHDLI